MTSTFWRDRPVLVTGATGLLGGWLVSHLLREQADVVVLIRDWTPKSMLISGDSFKSVRSVRGDVRNQRLIERALGEYEIDTVFHLAAQTIVGVANRNPISTLDTNVRGTWVVCEAARRSPSVNGVIIASSDKAYGDHDTLPYTEDAPLQGMHPYDVSKSAADLIARMFATTYDLPVAITRCGNFFGGGDLNWNRLVPGTIRSALRGEAPVIRSDGTLIRDYIYVEDGALAYMKLAEALQSRPELRGAAFNFSNELQLDVLSLVSHIVSLIDPSLTPVIMGNAPHEIRHQSLSADKAKTLLGWAPTFTLEEGLVRTVDWYRGFLAD